MNQKTSGLGRGLSSLIPQKTTQQLSKEIGERVFEVPVEKIKPNPRQPRASFDVQASEELVESIKEHGILQPLIAIKTGDEYELIAGERRLRAAKAVGMETVPVVVRAADEQQKLELSLIENLQRQDLNPIEEAKAFRALYKEFGLSHDIISKQVGKSRPVISNTMRLLDLPQDIQQALIDKKIAYSAARALLALTPAEQRRTFEQLMRGEKVLTTEIEKKAPPQHRYEDPNLKAAEAKLREALGTKVTVKRRGTRGTIIIEFYSNEELASVLKRF